MNVGGWLLVLLCTWQAVCQAQEVTLSSSTCNTDQYMGGYDIVRIKFDGRTLPPTCRIDIINNGDFKDDFCVDPEKLYISDSTSGINIKYFDDFYTSISPEREYDYYNQEPSEWCTTFSSLIILFASNGSAGSADIEFKIYLKPNNHAQEIMDAAKSIVYIIVGVIVGCIVLVIVAVVVVCLCCCRKQQNAPGTVYRTPDTVPATGVYPMTGYQPVVQPQGQAGYQPPQQGYPAQPGYPPAQAGYPPPEK